MSEPDQFPDEDVDDWFRHPATIAKAKAWLNTQKKMHDELMRACSGSSDPMVRDKYSSYLAATAVLATLIPQKKEVNGKHG